MASELKSGDLRPEPIEGPERDATSPEDRPASGGATLSRKRLLMAAGVSLTIASIVFVGVSVVSSWGTIAPSLGHPAFIASLVAEACLYAALSVLIAIAWHVLIAALDPRLGASTAIILYGRTQILKYLPGNVVHVMGRWAGARSRGVGNAAIGWSTGAEIVLITGTAAAIAVLTSLPLLVEWASWRALVVPFAGLAVAALVAVALRRRLRRAVAGFDPRRLLRAAVIACALYAVFFLVNGIMVAALLAVAGGRGIIIAPETIGLFAVAWLVGFVTPGAPSGVGVREAVLTAGFALIGEENGAAVAIAYRIVTLGGDLLLAGACTGLGGRGRQPIPRE